MMKTIHGISRRQFLEATGAAAGWAVLGGWPDARLLASQVSTPNADMAALRQAVVQTPVGVALHRAKVYTQVFRQTEGQPWVVRKAKALREYLETVPIYLRPNDRIAGSISESPGAMPVIVEIGIGENNIYLSENPGRKGYLAGQVPEEILDYWKNANLWGRYRSEILGQPPVKRHAELPVVSPNYKFICNQGHLCPSYRELLQGGLDGLRAKVVARGKGETDAEKLRVPQRGRIRDFGRRRLVAAVR